MPTVKKHGMTPEWGKLQSKTFSKGQNTLLNQKFPSISAPYVFRSRFSSTNSVNLSFCKIHKYEPQERSQFGCAVKCHHLILQSICPTLETEISFKIKTAKQYSYVHHTHSVPCAERKADTTCTISLERRGCEDLFFTASVQQNQFLVCTTQRWCQ